MLLIVAYQQKLCLLSSNSGSFSVVLSLSQSWLTSMTLVALRFLLRTFLTAFPLSCLFFPYFAICLAPNKNLPCLEPMNVSVVMVLKVHGSIIDIFVWSIIEVLVWSSVLLWSLDNASDELPIIND